MFLSCIETRNCWVPLSILLGQLLGELILHTLSSLTIINIIPVICVQEPPEKVQTLTPTQTRRVCSVPAASTSTAKAGAGAPSTRPRRTPRGRASPGAGATTATTHTTSWTTEQAKIFVLCREDRVYVHTSWCIFIIKLHNNLGFYRD